MGDQGTTGLQSNAGADSDASVMALPIGHRLGEYVIQEVLAARGTTIVYRASTGVHGQPMVVKEFLPFDLAERTAQGQVQPREERMAWLYAKGLQAFLNEARLLAEFDHPSVVKVERWWEQDGTAYQAVALLKGVTLHKWLADLGTPPSETWLRQMLPALFQALSYLHGKGCFHRSLSADNILLLADPEAGSYLEQRPRPVLLGLDAARRTIAQATQEPASLLAGGCVPVELSDGAITARQGSWTDVYGLCAVLYSAVVGRAPPSPLSRLVRDDMVSARKLGRGRYSPELLAAIDAGLVVQPLQRTQTMEELEQLLNAPAPGPAAAATDASMAAPVSAAADGVMSAAAAAGADRQASGPQRRRLWVWPAWAGALLLLAALLGAFLRA